MLKFIAMKTFLFLVTFCGYYLAGAGFIFLICPKCGFTNITSDAGYVVVGGILSIFAALCTITELREEGKI
jgi:hypothetical protein